MFQDTVIGLQVMSGFESIVDLCFRIQLNALSGFESIVRLKLCFRIHLLVFSHCQDFSLLGVFVSGYSYWSAGTGRILVFCWFMFQDTVIGL